MNAINPLLYRYPLVRPDLPPPEEWVPFLEESYRNHWFSNFGPVATRLGNGLAEEFAPRGDRFVVCASATAGLAACLIAARISGPVLLPAFTFPASAAAVRMAGATPVVIDVDVATWACDADKLDRALSAIPSAAVMLVAPFGISLDFREHFSIAQKHGAAVIVDNAAGLGTTCLPEECSDSTFEVFSLHATKPFAIGEGGAIRCNERNVRALQSALNFGLPWQDRTTSYLGINGKMAETVAAIGLAVLPKYQDVLQYRRRQAQRYIDMFGHLPGLVLNRAIETAPWQVFPCLMPSVRTAEALVDEAKRHKVELRRYYRPSLDQWDGISTHGECTSSIYLSERMVCLPIYSRISNEEVAELHAILVDCFQRVLRDGN